MKNRIIFFVIILFSIQTTFSQIKQGRNQSFDANWKFQKGKGVDAKATDFNDTDWRKLDLPHDWSIEDLTDTPNDSTVGPFYKNNAGKNATAFTVGGTAWYRKTFTMDKSTAGKKVFIQFDGVYMNADVWINGHHLGNHPYGYTAFVHDLTEHLNPAGTPNVVAVEVKNEGYNSRWYSGSGIYRHVWLNVVNPSHIGNWGVQIVSKNVSEQVADIHFTTEIENSVANLSLTVEIYSADNKLISANAAEVSGKDKVEQMINLKSPKLWDIENPYLYKAKMILKQNGKLIDEQTQSFGVRSIHFDAKTGFTLNGKNIKLKGGCIHHDNGPLGAAAIDRAEERKIELLKKNGYNAVRFAHNPFSAALLDACDRLGMLVMDEAFDMWNTNKTPDDYADYFKDWWQKDLTSIIQKDFNHPSIIMWSIGNEIPEIIDSTGHKTSKILADFVRNLDDSRPVINAIPFHLPLIARKKWDVTDPAFASLDVGGYNYATQYYEGDHKKFPERIMVATEYFPPKALENWNYVEKNPYVIGMFSWSAIDYLGEAGLGLSRLKNKTDKVGGFQDTFMAPEWPIFNAYTGELDLIGNKKASSYYLDVVWRNTPIEMMVHRPIPAGKKELTGFYDFPDEMKSWTWPGHENDTLQVRVFTRSSVVKLELNGKIIAEQKLEKGSIIAKFNVPYTAGKLVARSFEGEKEIASETLTTAGKPFAVRLKSDRTTIKASKNDLAYIAVEIVDSEGNIVPNIDDKLIKYQITGNGILVGAGNGNPRDMSSFKKPEKNVFQGRGLVIIQPNGKAGNISIKATSTDLKDGILMIKSK
ncbi:glycoside hydrolase family 2 protein [Lacihabitans sp. CCS-44]|uniref:glycoside hydrolase family 2 TIM barrel-domain containing protein n=1 Tax=Lacihabitans sp. CCS-44 TaxID=2487331 RepID=UPI0020CEF32C|nr:glycoside hydrolase family 2 TIM barrel-domain containing protein [Lacihabitans sp. CCS-44]MCP9755524.1 glycoside hydrolase family 2 protein [Lacihabitans sp. CCS-44]